MGACVSLAPLAASHACSAEAGSFINDGERGRSCRGRVLVCGGEGPRALGTREGSGTSMQAVCMEWQPADALAPLPAHRRRCLLPPWVAACLTLALLLSCSAGPRAAVAGRRRDAILGAATHAVCECRAAAGWGAVSHGAHACRVLACCMAR